jgi:hypothetical protein
VVKEYLAETVMTSGVIERPGGEGLILRGERVFDERVFRLLYNGHKYAIIASVTVRKSIHQLGLYDGYQMVSDESGSVFKKLQFVTV